MTPLHSGGLKELSSYSICAFALLQMRAPLNLLGCAYNDPPCHVLKAGWPTIYFGKHIASLLVLSTLFTVEKRRVLLPAEFALYEDALQGDSVNGVSLPDVRGFQCLKYFDVFFFPLKTVRSRAGQHFTDHAAEYLWLSLIINQRYSRQRIRAASHEVNTIHYVCSDCNYVLKRC